LEHSTSRLDLNAALASVARERDPSEMSLAELRARKQPASTSCSPDQSSCSGVFRFRSRVLAFAAVAVPLGLRPSNSVRSRGFLISLGLILAYYVLLTFGQSLAERGVAPTAPAMWLPNLLVMALAAVLFRRAAREPARQNASQPGAGRACCICIRPARTTMAASSRA
jgi:hypothetical protein